MSHWWSFLLGVVVFVTLTWFWEWITGQQYEKLVRELDERQAALQNERLREELSELGPLGRGEIWSRMSWLWKETRGWVFRSGSVLAFVFLVFFAGLYLYCWIKTLLWPSSRDLRLLLAARLLLLYVAQDRK